MSSEKSAPTLEEGKTEEVTEEKSEEGTEEKSEEKPEEGTEEKTAEDYIANNGVMVRPVILKRQYEIYALLPQLFSKFGFVTRIDPDGQHRIIRQHKDWNRQQYAFGIACLTMESNDAASEAAAELDGKNIDDTNVRVTVMDPKTEHKVEPVPRQWQAFGNGPNVMLGTTGF